MSDSHLPDDPAQWPANPFTLLGVDQKVDRRELRRAYTRLIRRFKPEHFPEQFRRIRDAYESVERYLQYREFRVVAIPSAEEIPADEAADAPSGDGAEPTDESARCVGASDY